MNKNDRLQALIDYYSNGAKTEFAKKLGIAPSTLSSWIKRETLDYDLLFAKCENVNTEWLLSGKGDIVICGDWIENKRVNIIGNSKLSDRIIGNQVIKLYELDAAANLNTLNLEASREFAENIQVPNAPKCDGATYVKGDSMYPLLKSGDIVAFKQVHNIDYILYGEMYLVSYTIDGDDYLVVKFVCKSEKEGHVKLVSQNEYHAPRDIPVSSIRYLGIIKISIRLNSSI